MNDVAETGNNGTIQAGKEYRQERYSLVELNNAGELFFYLCI
jgi:hypothetical protein